MPPLSAIAAPRYRPIRVLLTSPSTSMPGGVAQYLRVLQPHLGSQVQYFVVGSRREGERVGGSVLRLIRDSWRFTASLWRGNYDIVHLNPSIGLKALFRDGILLVLAKALRKSVVVLAHGWDDACEHALLTGLSGLFRLVYSRADAFIVLGSEFKNRLRMLGYDGAVFIHGAPVEDQLFDYCKRRRARRSGGSGGRKFNILFLARVEAEKGIFEALEAYQILKRRHPFVSLVVAGSGSQLDSAIEYARTRQLADVSFLGSLEGPAKYAVFSAAEAYLFPSHSEGLPLSVLEAMASGLPIVTSAVGGLRDFFQDGRMGFMTENLDPDILASLLSQLICDPNLSLRVSNFNYTYAREHFRAASVAAELAGVYRFLLQSAH
jgi:glycosyltransferase involved in cell wall biosynthesis